MEAACIDDFVLLEAAEGRRRLSAREQEHVGNCSDCRRILAVAARGAGERHGAQGHPHAPDPPTFTEPSWDELGRGVVVGRGAYVLERFLGHGGMGVVWAGTRASANPSERYPVALKIGRAPNTPEEGIELGRRFEREARALGALAHPNVVRVYDVLPATSHLGPCIVQELVVGETLADRLTRERRLSIRDAARVLLPVASALEGAHARGIVHRDVKPSNVLLESATGRVVVVDFGIAKLLPSWGAHSKLTHTGTVVGTPRYMAPEQVFGETDIDARVDVWALGAVLFRAIAGVDLFEVDGAGEIAREMAREMAHGKQSRSVRNALPAEVAATLPANVSWLLEGALTLSRTARIESVLPFLAILSVHAR